ncbi:MAG: ABC transporter substrate-binding protein [Pseudomonadota bacterium]
MSMTAALPALSQRPAPHRPPFTAHAFGRFGSVCASLVLAAVAVLAFAPAATAQKSDPARAFMQRAANALISAQRQGTSEAFARVIRKYGHVPAIGMDALGTYRGGLRKASRQKYYRGIVKFIGRYAAKEGRKYPVSRVTFPSPAIRDGRHVLVDSKVYLKDGSQYDVRWMLLPSGRTYRVRDAQVIGFWVSPFLKTLFENYIRDAGGRVDALVVALNR